MLRQLKICRGHMLAAQKTMWDTSMANSGHLDPERLKTAASDSQPSEDNLYNPTTLALMTRVLDGAWTEAQAFYVDSAIDRSVIRASMAQRIIEAIEAGVTDEDSLRRAALAFRQDDIH
jgi:hypothetical protein